ncbi:MAG: type II secretion system protein [Pseudomonadota bacterium]|nr:type II secretion system protein [Pseudomonadota bacterium]
MTRLLFIKIQPSVRAQKGFTLVELIVTLVLVGIIGTFTTLFMYTGLNGYLRAKDTSEGALKAQIALDRISLELRDIDKIDLVTYSDDTRIDYTSVTLPGNRKILYNGGVISLDVDGNVNALLDEVSDFTLRMTPQELNYFADNKDEVQAIDVSFKVGDIERAFSARIFPRHMVPAEL